MRVAVLEAQVVQCLRADAGHAELRDVGGERACVFAGIRIGGAELGHVAVAEGVLGRALGMRGGEGAVVEEHGPGADGQPAPAGGRDASGSTCAASLTGGCSRAARSAGPGGKKTAPPSRNRTLRTGLCGKTSRPSW